MQLFIYFANIVICGRGCLIENFASDTNLSAFLTTGSLHTQPWRFRASGTPSHTRFADDSATNSVVEGAVDGLMELCHAQGKTEETERVRQQWPT